MLVDTVQEDLGKADERADGCELEKNEVEGNWLVLILPLFVFSANYDDALALICAECDC